MTVLATDNFTRANAGNLGANWTDAIAGWSIVSNQASATASAPNLSGYSAILWPNDQYSQATAITVDAVGPALRISGIGSAATGYVLLVHSSFTQAFRLDPSFTFNSIWSDGTHWAANDVVYLQVQGSTFTVNRNGSFLATFSDATYSSGRSGIFGLPASSGLLDAWSGGGFSTSSGGQMLMGVG
jgi:hypothetical protein